MINCPHCGRSLNMAARADNCPHCHGQLAKEPPTDKKSLPTGTLDPSAFAGSMQEGEQATGGSVLDHLIPGHPSFESRNATDQSAADSPGPGVSGQETMVGTHDTKPGGTQADQTLVGVPQDLTDPNGPATPAHSNPPLIDEIPPLVTGPGAQLGQHGTTPSSADQTVIGTPPRTSSNEQTISAAGPPGLSPNGDDADRSRENPVGSTTGNTELPGLVDSQSHENDPVPTDSRTIQAPSPLHQNAVDATMQSSIDSQSLGSRTDGSASDSGSDVKGLWEEFADSQVGPMASIKSDDMSVGREEGLVIHRRALAPSDAPEADESDYKVVRYLGQGAMGVVFEAKQTSMQREVAIKTLRPELARKVGDRQKFLYEASITGNLDHPNIVPIHDVGVNPDGTVFYSMKRVEGTPWQDVMHTKSRNDNIEVLLKVADAVSFAHSRNVIHRDLKPENVMLGMFGEVLVMDWGLAVNLDKGKDFVLGGTPAYMAPEMARHQVDLIDARSDIYLLGAMLFQLVVGLPPHPGETVTQCVSAAARNQIIPIESSDELLSIALQAMETMPSGRYETVHDFQQAIRDYQDHAESILMTQRAEEDLEFAIKNRDYPAFSRARFGFEDAVKLWPDNEQAVVGVRQAKLAHATEALARQDFDLGMSMLDESSPEETSLYNQLSKGARERENRLKRIRAARMSAFLFMATALIVAGVGAFLVNQQRLKAQSAEKRAIKNAEQAKEEKEIADQKTELARIAEGKAKKSAEAARISAKEAEDQRKVAKAAQKNAEANLKTANEERQRALEARTAALRSKVDATEKSVEAAQTSVDIAESNIEVLLGKLQADLTLIRTNLANWNLQPALAGLQSIIRNSDERVSYPISFKDWETYRLLYLAQAGRPKAEIDTTVPIVDVAVSEDGKHFAVAGNDGSVRVYSTVSLELVNSFQVPAGVSDRISAVDISSASSHLIVGVDASNEDNLYFWDFATGQQLTNQPGIGHADGVKDVHLSADGLTLLTCGREVSASPYKTLRWWKRETTEDPFVPFRTGDLNYAASYRVDLSPDGKRVLLVCDRAAEILRDGTTVNRRVVGLFVDEEYGEEENLSEPVVLEYPEGEVVSAMFDPSDVSGNQVFATTNDGLLLHWRVESFPEKSRNPIDRVATNIVETKYEGHLRTREVTSLFAVRVPGRTRNGEPAIRMATGGADGRLILWNKSESAPWKSLVGHTGQITSVGFFDQGTKVYSGCEDGRLRLWETRELVDELALEPKRPAESPVLPDVLDHSFSLTEPWIAGGDQVGQVTIWHAVNGQELGSLRIGHEYGREMSTDYDAVSGRLITASAEGSTRVWDTKSGSLLRVWNDTLQPDEMIGVSPNHRWLLQGVSAGVAEPILRLIDLDATSGTEGTITIPWSEIVRADLDFSNIQRLAVSDDGNVIAVATRNRVYGYVVDRKEQLRHDENEVKTLRFLPNSTTVLTASSGNVRVFSPANWTSRAVKFDSGMISTRILDLRVVDDKVFLVLTGDSRTDGNQERQVRVYDCTNWAEREPMSSNYTEAPAFGPVSLEGRVSSGTFDASGENLILLTGEEQLLKWNLSENKLQPATELHSIANRVRNQSRLSSDQAVPPLRQLLISRSQELILSGPGFADVWNLEQQVEKFRVPTALPVRSVRFARDSNRLIVTHGNGHVRVWKVSPSDEEDGSFRWEMETLIPGDFRLALPSPVDNSILLLNSRGEVAFHDRQTGEQIAKFDTSDDRTVTAVDWIAGQDENSWLLVGTKKGFASLLKLERETITIDSMLPIIPASNADISAVSLSPDLRYAAIGNVDGKAILVPLKQWREHKEQPPLLELRSTSAIKSLAFNRSSTRLLLTQAQRASLWHLDGLNPGLVRPLLNLEHTHEVRRSLFSPNGLIVATAPRDEGRIILWKATPWKSSQGDVVEQDWTPEGKSIDDRRQESRAALAAAVAAQEVAEQELQAAQEEQERAASDLEAQLNEDNAPVDTKTTENDGSTTSDL